MACCVRGQVCPDSRMWQAPGPGHLALSLRSDVSLTLLPSLYASEMDSTHTPQPLRIL